MPRCCIPGCSENGRWAVPIESRKPLLESIGLRPPPDDPVFQPSWNMKICSVHYGPDIEHGTNAWTSARAMAREGRLPKNERARLLSDAEKLHGAPLLPRRSTGRRSLGNELDLAQLRPEDMSKEQLLQEVKNERVAGDQYRTMLLKEKQAQEQTMSRHISQLQAENKRLREALAQVELERDELRTAASRRICRVSFESLISQPETNAEQVRAVIGIPQKRLEEVAKILEPISRPFETRFGRKCKLSLEEKLAVTLVRFKLAISYEALGLIYGVSTKVAREAVWEGIVTFAGLWRSFFPQDRVRQLVEKATQDLTQIPKASLRQKFLLHRCVGIIDCFEQPVQRPSDVHLQRVFYSYYKHTHTVKVLVLVGMDLLPKFVSQCYPGGISDDAILKKSGVLEQLSGYALMCDKGWSEEVFRSHNVSCLVPNRLKKRAAFTHVESNYNASVSRDRVQVERYIRLCRTFKILRDRLSLQLLAHHDDVVRSVVLLTTLQPPLVAAQVVDAGPLDDDEAEDESEHGAATGHADEQNDKEEPPAGGGLSAQECQNLAEAYTGVQSLLRAELGGGSDLSGGNHEDEEDEDDEDGEEDVDEEDEEDEGPSLSAGVGDECGDANGQQTHSWDPALSIGSDSVPSTMSLSAHRRRTRTRFTPNRQFSMDEYQLNETEMFESDSEYSVADAPEEMGIDEDDDDEDTEMIL